MSATQRDPIVVVGAGFTGLAAAYDLVRHGHRVLVLEQDDSIGGLAGSFTVNGQSLEKFYHHWFTSDQHVMTLLEELGLRDRLRLRPSRTGMYYANRFFRLSTPLDLLRFSPLGVLDRIRLGLVALRARRVTDWRELESRTAEEWLLNIGGARVFEVVWEPLLRGKFGEYASDVSAVWFWNKLKLRGGSRGKRGEEVLAYFDGGFGALAARLADEIREGGGEIRTDCADTALRTRNGDLVAVATSRGEIPASGAILTPALPIVADLLEPHASREYADGLRRVRYLANVCIVLGLDRSLSETYWLNVNDPSFPFVGVIEHTNFEPPPTYGGRHIVYLSKYLPESDELYQMSDTDAVRFCVPYLRRMFPAFDESWIQESHVWRARYAQPVVERGYSRLIPPVETPVRGAFLATMAQIYPEDRGTNYAIGEGRKIARVVDGFLHLPERPVRS